MLKCEVQVQGKEKTVPSDGDGVEVPEPPERREKQLQLTAVMLTLLWRHPPAPHTQVHPAGGQLALLPEPPATLEPDLGILNKLNSLFDLHKNFFFFFHADLMMSVTIMFKKK